MLRIGRCRRTIRALFDEQRQIVREPEEEDAVRAGVLTDGSQCSLDAPIDLIGGHGEEVARDGRDQPRKAGVVGERPASVFDLVPWILEASSSLHRGPCVLQRALAALAGHSRHGTTPRPAIATRHIRKPILGCSYPYSLYQEDARESIGCYPRLADESPRARAERVCASADLDLPLCGIVFRSLAMPMASGRNSARIDAKPGQKRRGRVLR